MALGTFVTCTSVLLLFQIGFSYGLLNNLKVLQPVELVSPLLNESLPFKQILAAIQIENYPNLDDEIKKYNSYSTENKPKCCRPDQFPVLFQFLADFFFVIENIGTEATDLLCDLLQLITPLSCKETLLEYQRNHPNGKNPIQKSKGMQELGCVLDALFGSLFGKIGILVSSVVIGLLLPADSIDGCLVHGVAQAITETAYDETNPQLGDAVGPIAVGLAISMVYCVGEPFTSMVADAYEPAIKQIMDYCDKYFQKQLF